MTYVDYDDPSLERVYEGELPVGVSFDDTSNTLTITDTELDNLYIESWASTPLQIIISGDVTINAVAFDDLPALLIDCSYNVTISGESLDDKLSLCSETSNALRFGCLVPYSESESEGSLTNPDGRLTIKNLTLDATSDYRGESFRYDERYNWTAVGLTGGALFENIALTTDGYYGIDNQGDITYDRCTVNTSATCFGPLEKRMGVNDLDTEYEGKSLIKDTVFTITASGEPETEEFGALLRVYRNALTVEGTSKITIDASIAPTDLSALTVSGNEELKSTTASFNMSGGTLDIKLQNGDTGESVVQYCNPCRIENSAKWTQTGGDVTVTAYMSEYDDDILYDSHAFTVGSGASFNMSGGSFTVDNKNDEDVEVLSKIFGLCGWEDSELNFSGGTFTVTGTANKPYDVALWVWDKMTVTGDAVLNLKGTLQTETKSSHIEIFGGTVNIQSYYYDECVNIGSALSVYGGTMNLSATGCSEGIFASWGNVRFLGGVVNIKAGSALTCITHSDQFTFGDGVRAAFSDGTEAKIMELRSGDRLIGWATDTDYIYNDYNVVPENIVTIKKQGVKADVEKSYLNFEITNTSALAAGVPVNFRIIPVLTTTTGTLTVALPDSLVLNGVTVNNQKVDASSTTEGFSLTVNNGDIVRFTATPSEVGEITVSASVNGVRSELDFEVEVYTLSIPSVIKYPNFIVFGSSAPGSTVTFYERNGSSSTPIGSAKANAAGTWKAELSVIGGTGSHTIYAVVKLNDSEVATSGDYCVTYDGTHAVVETLTITNYIHGATSADPDKEVSVTLDYIDGTRTQNYYIYWSELPEFRFDVKFSGKDGTPENISDVAVIATDRLGETAQVALTYDAKTGLWSGSRELCNEGNIVPDRFRVVWCEEGFIMEDEEEIEAVKMPSRRDEPEDSMTDSTTDAFVSVQSGTYELPLSEGTTGIKSVTTIEGTPVEYKTDSDTCSFSVVPGEMYIVDVEGKHKGKDRLLVVCEGGAGEDVVELKKNVIVPEGSITLNDNTSTFEASANYKVGDVIHTGDGYGIVVTGVDNGTYTYRNAYIDEIYQKLDVSSMNLDAMVWEVDEDEIAAQFMDTALFASYTAAIEATFSEEYELGDNNVEVEVTAYADTDGVLSIEPVITVTTEAKTKLPNDVERETTIKATFSGKIEQDYDFRVRFDGDTENFSLYFATTNTITNGLDIDIGLTFGESEDEYAKIENYFAELKDEVVGNFLEALTNEDEKTATITFKKLAIPTSVPGVVVYAEPSFELNWGFFGELELGAEVTTSSKSGFAMTCIGGEWSTATFGDFEDPELKANAELHVTAFVEGMLRADAGVSLLRVFDAGIYGMIGPRLDLAGHGIAAYPDNDARAELTVRFGIRAEAGVHFKLALSEKIVFLDKDLTVYERYIPLGHIGWGEMPTRFDIIEGPNPVLMPKEYKIVEHIPLAMRLQTFDGEEVSGTKVYSENDYERYTFEVVEGPVRIEGEGANATVVIDNPNESCTYKIRVTFKSNNYELYKVVPLCYVPSYIEVHVTAEKVKPIAGIEIIDLKNSQIFYSGSTDSGGYLIAAVPEGTYSVAQITPPNRNILISKSPIEPVVVESGSSGTASFANAIPPQNSTYDFPLQDIGDPSGYVYEGIESNRLEGVTTTIYYKQSEDSDDITKWDATEYDQLNPLKTDPLGQYLWMVPSGWWRIEYELGGYNTVYSEWMDVPPIRTGINVNLTSNNPADMTIEYSEYDGNLLLRFTRPVKVSSISDMTISIDGVLYEGYFEVIAADAAWSVTADPEDSTVCATVFRMYIGEYIAGKSVSVSIEDVETYQGIQSLLVSDSKYIPVEAVSYTVTFDANGGYVTPASAITGTDGKLVNLPTPTRSGYTFNGWFTASASGTEVTESYVFTSDTTIFAQWTESSAPTPPAYIHDLHVYISNRMENSVTTPQDYTPTVHVCESKCDVCGGCKNAKCTESVCEDKCRLLNMYFTDVESGQWYTEAVEYVYHRNIMNSVGNDIFGVNGTATRAMIVTILWRLEGEPVVNYLMRFDDVPAGQWYTEAIRWAASEKIVEGYGDGKFGTNDAITREQLATILYRYEQHKGGGFTGTWMIRMDYVDLADVSDWAYEAMCWMNMNGVMNGKPGKVLDPKGMATRAQVAVILQRYCEIMSGLN